MPSWSVEYASRAEKDIADLASDVRAEIFAAMGRLIEDPPQGDIKKLKAQKGAWRLRVGKWRVFFSRDKAQRVLYILRVVRRSDTTYS